MRSSLEKPIENSILAYLELLPECFAWKNQNVGIFDPVRKQYRKSNSRFQQHSVSDILGIYKGKMMAIEVKKPEDYKFIMKNYEALRNGAMALSDRNKRFAKQIDFIENIKVQGGIAGFADSIERVKELLLHK